MAIISYAQNFEDVMLSRALKCVENGFYIDVGANHPEIDSVTKAFYDNGWSGINIEPELELYELLKKDRPRDINLNVAISSSVSSVDFYVSSIRGWSTTDDKSSKNLEEKGSLSEVRTIEALSLDELCLAHNVEVVHFLKVDVEGAEKDVLESFSFGRVRPWVCIVEATKPTTQIDVSGEWEESLLGKGYIFVYFDGLNKYYVACEHEDLIKLFGAPPNVFDKFVLAGQSQAEEKASQAELRAQDLSLQLRAIHNSSSWKLTSPLRLLDRVTKSLLAKIRLGTGQLINDCDVNWPLEEEKLSDYIYKSSQGKGGPIVVADMYVVAQGVKTGVYRVCDELFKRMDRDKRIDFRGYLEFGFVKNGEDYLKRGSFECLDGKEEFSIRDCAESFYISPFGVANYDIKQSKNMRHVHFIYDLIAINNPEYFTEEGAVEVKEIMDSLTDKTIIFAISEYTKRELLDYRKDLSPRQVTVIPLAADEKFYPVNDKNQRKRVCDKYDIPKDAPYLLSLATLEVRKNIESVIESYNQYLSDNPDSTLNLVLSGMKGWKLEKLQEKLKKYSAIKGRIIFTGFVEEEDLPVLYSNALLFLYMSKSEGFGLPPLEAMACGLPVVTSNNTSLPEVVGDAGLMFGCDDYQSVALVIKDFYDDRCLREKYSKLGVERAKGFKWEKATDLILERLHDEVAREDELWPVWKEGLAFKGDKVEGGLRLQGNVKCSRSNSPLVSYVTVVWNNEKDIRRTIESVQAQSYDNVEHIILDGGSTDKTLTIIQEYEKVLDYYASEPDDGLYDALNKAIPLCKGELICVLNSDDWLPMDAAEKIASSYKGNVKELILGSAKVEVDKNGVIIWAPLEVSMNSYFTVANCCHNAIYATKGAYLASGPYDKSYAIAADFKWVMSCYDGGVTFNYSAAIVVNYSLGGISGDSAKHIVEAKRVIEERFPFLSQEEINTLNYCYYTWRDKLKHEDYQDIDTEGYIKNIFEKYSFSKSFQEALPYKCTIPLSVVRGKDLKSRLKKILKRFPKLYGIIRRVYNLKNG